MITDVYHYAMNSKGIRNVGGEPGDSRFKRRHALQNLGLIMIMVAGAIPRFVRLDYQSMWFDELYNAQVRKVPLSDMVPEILAAGHPPVFIFIGHIWSWTGSGEIAVRSLSALIGVATIAAAYLAGRELFSRQAGLWAAALAAFSPFLIWYSRDATSYSWVILVSLLSFFLLVRSSGKGGWRNWTGYVFITGLAAFSHFYMIAFILASVPVFWLLRRKNGEVRPWFFSQAAVFAIVMISMGVGKVFAGSKTDVSIPALGLVIRGIVAAPIVYLQGYVKVFSAPPATMILSKEYWGLALVLLLTAALAIIISKVKEWHFLSREVAAVASTLVLYVLITALLHNLLGGFNSGRYFAMGAPLLLLLLAAFIVSMPRIAGVLTGVAILVVSLSLTMVELNQQRNDDWRGTMRVISEELSPGDQLLCFPINHCVAAAQFYLDQPVLIRGGFRRDSQSPVLMKTPESSWASYRAERGYEDYEEFSDEGLERKLEADLSVEGRVWMIAGDGSVGYYPAADNVAAALYDGRTLLRVWHRTPFILNLFQAARADAAN